MKFMLGGNVYDSMVIGNACDFHGGWQHVRCFTLVGSVYDCIHVANCHENSYALPAAMKSYTLPTTMKSHLGCQPP